MVVLILLRSFFSWRKKDKAKGRPQEKMWRPFFVSFCGQVVLEYFILFALIAALAYFSFSSGLFERIKGKGIDDDPDNPAACEQILRAAVGRIVGE